MRGSHSGLRSGTNWSVPLGHGKTSPSFVPNRTRAELSRHADAIPQARSRVSAAALNTASMPPNRSSQAEHRGTYNGESSRSGACSGDGMIIDRQTGGIPDPDVTFDDQRYTQRHGHTSEMVERTGLSHGSSRIGGNSNNSFRNSALSLIPRDEERPSVGGTRSNATMRGAVRGGMNVGGQYQPNSHGGPSNSVRNTMDARGRHQETTRAGPSNSGRSTSDIDTYTMSMLSLIPGVIEQQGDRKLLLNTSSSHGMNNQEQQHASRDPRMSNAYSSINGQEQRPALQDPRVSNAYSSINSNEPQDYLQVQNTQVGGYNYSNGETSLTPHFRIAKFGRFIIRFVVCFCSNPRGYLPGMPRAPVYEDKRKEHYEWSQWSSLTVEQRAQERRRYILIIRRLEMEQYASHHSEIWHIGEAADRRIVDRRIRETVAKPIRAINMQRRSKEYKLSQEYMGMISPTHPPKHGWVELDESKVPMEHWSVLLHLYKDRYVPRTAEQRLSSFDLDKYIAAQPPKEEVEGVTPNDHEKSVDTQPLMVNKGKGNIIDKGKGKEKVVAKEEGEQVEEPSLGVAVMGDIKEETDAQPSMIRKWKGKGKQEGEPSFKGMASRDIEEKLKRIASGMLTRIKTKA